MTNFFDGAKGIFFFLIMVLIINAVGGTKSTYYFVLLVTFGVVVSRSKEIGQLYNEVKNTKATTQEPKEIYKMSGEYYYQQNGQALG